jgi:hypothetical protein
MVSAYDGHTEEAVKSLMLALDNWNAWIWPYQPTISNPLLAPLMEREDFRRALRANQAVIDKQRTEVVEMLCGANPVSKTYRPARATCAGTAKRP